MTLADIGQSEGLGELQMLNAIFDKSQTYNTQFTLEFFDALSQRVCVKNALIILSIFTSFKSQEALDARSDCINELLNEIEESWEKEEDSEASEYEEKELEGVIE